MVFLGSKRARIWWQIPPQNSRDILTALFYLLHMGLEALTCRNIRMIRSCGCTGLGCLLRCHGGSCSIRACGQLLNGLLTPWLLCTGHACATFMSHWWSAVRCPGTATSSFASSPCWPSWTAFNKLGAVWMIFLFTFPPTTRSISFST